MAHLKQGEFLPNNNSTLKPYHFVRDFPGDMIVVLLAVIVSIAFIYVPVLNGSFLRYIMAFLVLMFVPGYALMAFAFPRKSSMPGPERLVLSFAASIVVVPLIGFILNFTPWGVRLDPIVVSVSAFTIAFALWAAKRRTDLPEEERYEFGLKRNVSEIMTYIRPSSGSFTDHALGILLVIMVLVLSSTVAYVIISPGSKDTFTELYILGPDGKLGDYPVDFYVGHSQPIQVDVVNHELKDMEYSLAIYLDNGTGRIPLHSEQFSLGQNQTWEKDIDLMPDALGDRQKMVFDLYAGGDTVAPYRSVYLWVNVSPSGEPYTDLTVYGYNHSAPGRYADYWDIDSGKGFDVTVQNHEYRNVPYVFEIALTNGTQRSILYTQDMALAHNESWEKTIVVTPDREGMNMTLEFNLYAYGDKTTPYRFLDATTNVTQIPTNLTGRPIPPVVL